MSNSGDRDTYTAASAAARLYYAGDMTSDQARRLLTRRLSPVNIGAAVLEYDSAEVDALALEYSPAPDLTAVADSKQPAEIEGARLTLQFAAPPPPKRGKKYAEDLPLFGGVLQGGLFE